MPLQIIRQDITRMVCDAIVNAANPSLLGGGGVDGAIHRAAGPELLAECRTLGGCETGNAKITRAYDLPCRFVIHAVGPRWHGGDCGEEELLRGCYRAALKLAFENECKSVAFPLISSGIYGYPKAAALQVAVEEIGGFLLSHDMLVYLVVFDKASFQISRERMDTITEYIGEHYVEVHSKEGHLVYPTSVFTEKAIKMTDMADDIRLPCLDDVVNSLDESFSQMLLRKIDEKGLSDAEVYRKANVDRRLFSKIRSDVHYKTSKTTAIAFAIALELSLEETTELLMKAGFALSHSNKFDVIIEYFIKNGNYNIYEINEALFAFDQQLLGG